MRIVTLVLAFALIIVASFLYSSGQTVEALQPYKGYFWTPIALGILLFVFIFMQKVPDKGKEK